MLPISGVDSPLEEEEEELLLCATSGTSGFVDFVFLVELALTLEEDEADVLATAEFTLTALVAEAIEVAADGAAACDELISQTFPQQKVEQMCFFFLKLLILTNLLLFWVVDLLFIFFKKSISFFFLGFFFCFDFDVFF